MKTFDYNGRTFQYDEANALAFSFELGKFENSYKPLKYFSSHESAIDCYELYHVSNGYKKRLRMNGVTIAKQISNRGYSE